MEKTIPKQFLLAPKRETSKNTIIIAASAVVSAASIVFLLLFSQTESQITKSAEFIIGILIGIIPFTVIQLREVKRKDGIDKNMPLFLLALLSGVKTGAQIQDSIKSAATRNFGSLTREIKNLNATIGSGFPIADCFEVFALRCGTKISKRVATLLEISLNMGGDITQELELIQKHIAEMAELEKSRKSSLSPYVYTVYIAFFVFLAIALLLTINFVPEIEKIKAGFDTAAPTSGSNSPELFSAIKSFDPALLKSMMYNMAIIESVFGGLAVGKIGSSNYIAGIKHVIIMLVITIISFTLVG
jgi:flagellar protein FlaJ